MLGSIEDLNKDIEKFQNNIAASNELCDTINNLIQDIEKQNDVFEEKSNILIEQMQKLPQSIDDSNTKSNSAIEEKTQQQLNLAVHQFYAEQQKYIETLARLQLSIEQHSEKIEKTTSAIEEIPSQVAEEQKKQNSNQQVAFNNMLNATEKQITDEHKKYIMAMDQTREAVLGFEKELEQKTQDFLKTLEDTNITHLQAQNIEIKTILNKRSITILVMVLIATVFSLLGLFI